MTKVGYLYIERIYLYSIYYIIWFKQEVPSKMQVKELLEYTKIISECLDIIEANEQKNPNFYSGLELKDCYEKLLFEFGTWYQGIQTPSKDKSMKNIEQQRMTKGIIIAGIITLQKLKEE